ncbi:hypothetical protein J1N35_046054 [Gossypium stocksii]|uniref:DUF4283 domain-containing protein n=1 Tax=Gossypium stocksii TaxID=47602 RepID=A0A9D3U540_9ROSI|nr:hypothetical protein J1N35_046054 [Gossypium stocksii]
MEEVLADLRIEEEEETTIINFQSMHTMMANLWHPLRGVIIIDIGEKIILFRFYYEVDGGHGESYCPIHKSQGSKYLPLGWDISLKGPTRRVVASGILWLREPSSDWGIISGASGSNQGSDFRNQQILIWCAIIELI